jgi:serine/threonine protein kinase
MILGNSVPMGDISSVLETPFAMACLASGVVTQQHLATAIEQLARDTSTPVSPNQPPAPDQIAQTLVLQGVLTRYQADQLLAGRSKLTLGQYLITDWIGQGGMGQVFKAVHQVLRRQCAIKVLPITRSSPEARESFTREIRMQAQLDCPHLVRAYDAGVDGNVHFLVTEYVPGMDLRRLVRMHGPLSIQQAASILMQAALGLQYAHERGLVHRDVKPGNILVTPDGVAKVSDVGLAGFAADWSKDPLAGKIVGTADFISPEQITSPMEVQAVSDIYALGCTCYYAICGKVPFPGGDSRSKLRRHLEEMPYHPSKFNPQISEEFVDIIADMIEKDPKKRIQTAAEVAVRMEVWAGDAALLTSSRLSRGPWMAAPIPLHEKEMAPVAHEPTELSMSGADGSTSAAAMPPGWTGNDSPSSGLPDPARPTSAPPSSQGLVMSEESLRATRHAWIAMTVAIVLPPALLIGAILGFLACKAFFS